MSESVLISIRPKWCELIASGQKTIEVRKTKPKLETPFKCYIYCTSPKYEYEDLICICSETEEFRAIIGGRLVIGEFTCDAILPISVSYSDPNHRLANRVFPYTGMTDGEIMEYLGNGNPGYGWHISDLVIYDNPKDLSEFLRWYEDGEDIRPCQNGKRCQHLIYDYSEGCQACAIDFDGTNCPYLKVIRPPQSWCYVEEAAK